MSRGADEIDVVMNMPAMLSGEFSYVRNELARVVRAVRMKSVNSGRGLSARQGHHRDLLPHQQDEAARLPHRASRRAPTS